MLLCSLVYVVPGYTVSVNCSLHKLADSPVDATYKSELKETNDLNWERFKDHLDSRPKYMDAHLDSRLDRLRADLMKWMFIYWSGTVAAIIGMGYFGPK
jgi:hypothetical protein